MKQAISDVLEILKNSASVSTDPDWQKTFILPRAEYDAVVVKYLEDNTLLKSGMLIKNQDGSDFLSFCGYRIKTSEPDHVTILAKLFNDKLKEQNATD
jgi:hypothetical protein